jgi:hypothetical protein
MRVEFVSDRMSYIILRGRWCNIIVLNVLAPTDDKIDVIYIYSMIIHDHILNKFPKYQITFF